MIVLSPMEFQLCAFAALMLIAWGVERCGRDHVKIEGKHGTHEE